MAPSVVDVDNLPPNLPCKRCKTTPVNGVKCVVCGSVMHPGCLKYLKNVKVITENKFIKCCVEASADLDTTLNSSTESFETVVEPSSWEIEVNYLKQICEVKDKLLNEKDVVIATQSDLIQSLKEQISILKSSLNHVATPVERERNRQSDTKNEDIAVNLSADDNERHLISRSDTTSKHMVHTKGKHHQSKQTIKEINTDQGASKSNTLSAVNRIVNDPAIVIQSDNKRGTSDFGKGDIHTNEWTTVTKKKREDRSPKKRKQQGIVGTNTVANEKLVAASKMVSLFVSRLKPSTQLDTLKSYVQKHFSEAECSTLTPKHPEHYSSFRVCIDSSNVNRAMDPTLWPAGTYVAKFFPKRQIPLTRE